MDETNGRYLALLGLCSIRNRYSSVLEYWVRWKSSVTNDWAKSCPGCKPTSEVTCRGRITRSCRSNVWLWSWCKEIWGSICKFVLGRGGSCGRKLNLSSTQLVSRTSLPWVSLSLSLFVPFLFKIFFFHLFFFFFFPSYLTRDSL